MIQNATYRLRKNNNLLLKSMTLVAKINSKISTDKITGGGQMLHPRNWVPQVERKNFFKENYVPRLSDCFNCHWLCPFCTMIQKQSATSIT